jgi:hypothetical protein
MKDSSRGKNTKKTAASIKLQAKSKYTSGVLVLAFNL